MDNNYIEGQYENKVGNPFFTFSKPYLDFLDKGKLFHLIYLVGAILCLLMPLLILYSVIDAGVFSFGAKIVFAVILIWLAICFAGWIGFQLWWDRRKMIKDIDTSQFKAIPIVSDIVKTTGECFGTQIGIIGFAGGLFGLIFFGSELGWIFEMMGLSFMGIGGMIILSAPIMGFFIIILSRLIAELMLISASLANSTKEIAKNLKK